jgi:hypothetical protein
MCVKSSLRGWSSHELENLDMKKQDTTPTLFDMKLAVVNFHKGEQNEYLRISIARDACYTSFNSIEWKSEQMSVTKNELAALSASAGQEVVDINVGKKISLYRKMEDELAELQERHVADLKVYTEVTQGEVWTRKPKRTYVSEGLGDAAELQRILG